MKNKTRSRKTVQWSHIGQKQKLGIIAILTGAFVIGIAASYLYQSNKKSTTTTEVLAPSATAVVQLNVDKTQVSLSSPFTVNLTLDSAQNGVDAADFVLTYDKNKLYADKVETGEFFRTYPVNSVRKGSIKVSGVAYFENNQLVIPKGKGDVARITFTPLKKGATKIKIDPENTTIASAGKNILDVSQVKDLEIRIQ